MTNYGHLAYPGPDMIGPSTGYSGLLKREDCDLEAPDLQAFLRAAEQDSKRVWLPHMLDLSDHKEVGLGPNTYASDFEGGLGTLSMTTRFVPLIKPGGGAHFVGMRLVGPDPEIRTSGSEPYMTGALMRENAVTFEACIITAWPFAGCHARARNVVLRHCDLSYCRRAGFGYGADIQEGSIALIACRVDHCRHAFTSERGYDNDITLEYCIFGPNMTNTVISIHGGNDTKEGGWGPLEKGDASVCAGGLIIGHHNTYQSLTQPPVSVRGVPKRLAHFCNDWVYMSDAGYGPGGRYQQRLDKILGQVVDGEPITGDEYVHMEARDIWYGTKAPPEIVPPEPPPTSKLYVVEMDLATLAILGGVLTAEVKLTEGGVA